MATMQDVNKLRFNHTLDLRDWDLSPRAGLIDPLDLRTGSVEQADNFFEVMPAYVADSFLVPPEVLFKVPVVAEDTVGRARFMVKLGVVLAVAVLGLLAVMIAVIARTVTF